MAYSEILENLGGYEKSGVAGDFEGGLGRVKRILTKIGSPQEKYPVIHVVGSKGKGSTVRMIEQGLVAAGHKVGSYYSPHVYRVNERIRLNGEEISDEDLDAIVAEVFEVASDLTYFEFLTVCMFKFFMGQGVDYAVVEAGLGGRLDATNVASEPRCVVLTRVELEHTDILGDSLEEIEREKLAVVRGNAKLFRDGSNEELAQRVLDYLNPGQKVVTADLPGRFERRGDMILDIAHTEKSARFLREKLDKEFSKEKFVFLMSFLKGKNPKGIIDALVRDDDKLLLKPMDDERAMSREELAQYGEIVETLDWPEGFRPVVCGSSRLLQEV
ncbi:MAG: Mur ligase family protein [Patescibacteria group bacterium]|nr:hypothetical protein [Patescibacteria group bacterium]